MSVAKKRLLTGLFVLLALCLAGAALTGVSVPRASAADTAPIVCRASEDKITVSGSLSGNGTAKVLRFYAEEYLTPGEAGGFEEGEITLGSAYSLSFSRFETGGWDKVYDKYYVVQNGETLAGPMHVTELPSKYTYERPATPSKKGLQIQMIDDAQTLGVSHAAMNYSVMQMMYDDKPNRGSYIEFESGGKPYYFKKDMVEEYDRQIKNLSDNNIEVTLICLIWGSVYQTGPKALVHPGYQGPAGNQGRGEIAGYNVTDRAGVEYFTALMEFTAERYSREDQAYGRAMNYVIGNEVDTANIWYNCGILDQDTFVQQYTRTMRLASQAITKIYQNANVLISLDHLWNDDAYNFLGVGTQNGDVYRGKDIVDGLNALCASEGNFYWGIAYHPYPHDLFNPKFWETDEQIFKGQPITTKEFTTRKITFQNLEVLPRYLEQDAFQYEGKTRRIYLTEQGFNTRNPDSATDQQVQAAAYAYAYYKIQFLDGIDAFILHRQVDCKEESGLNLGLWSRQDTSSVTPREKKLVYDVFRYIDTEESLATTTPYLKQIRINGKAAASWKELIPKFDETEVAVRGLPEQLTTNKQESIQPTAHVSSFDTKDDTEGWRKADYSDSLKIMSVSTAKPETPYAGAGMAEVRFTTTDANGGARAARGMYQRFNDAPIDATTTPEFVFAVNLSDPGAAFADYDKTVTVKFYSGYHMAEATLAVQPDGWTPVSIDLSGWEYKDNIDGIKIWYTIDAGETMAGRLYIDEVGFVGGDGAAAGCGCGTVGFQSGTILGGVTVTALLLAALLALAARNRRRA